MDFKIKNIKKIEFNLALLYLSILIIYEKYVYFNYVLLHSKL